MDGLPTNECAMKMEESCMANWKKEKKNIAMYGEHIYVLD